MRLYLKPDYKAQQSSVLDYDGKMVTRPSYHLWDVELDNGLGKYFVESHTSISDEINISKELLEQIESVEADARIAPIIPSHHIEGVYRHNGAKLVATVNNNPENLARSLLERLNTDPSVMVLRITGPNVESVKAIYSFFRQGKLVPEESWGPPVARQAI